MKLQSSYLSIQMHLQKSQHLPACRVPPATVIKSNAKHNNTRKFHSKKEMRTFLCLFKISRGNQISNRTQIVYVCSQGLTKAGHTTAEKMAYYTTHVFFSMSSFVTNMNINLPIIISVLDGKSGLSFLEVVVLCVYVNPVLSVQ